MKRLNLNHNTEPYEGTISDLHTADKNHRFPLTGTIEQIGNDLSQIKDMGVDQIIFNFIFSALGRDIDRTIDVSRDLLEYVRWMIKDSLLRINILNFIIILLL